MATIEPVPIVPRGLKDAIDRDQLVVFIGAGVSRVVGCTGWDDLARVLLNACFENKYINYKEKERLTNEPDHRKTITICYHIIAERHSNPELFYQHLNAALLSKPERDREFPIYEELYRLRAIFVTTNSDVIFDNKLFNPQAIIYRARDFPTQSIDRTKLYHLHGSINDRSSLVFSVDEYILHYRKRQVHAFLTKLFTEYTILFVGYGLAELQLLEYLIIGNTKDDGAVRHFYLLPMYRGEENLFEFQQAYFKRFGIQTIAYDITDNGYEQIYHVIKSWQTEINLTSRALASTFEFIEQAAAYYEPSTAGQALQLIRNDPPVADHFLRHASDPQWLIPLKDAGYFDPTKNPAPIEVPDNPGMFTFPNWSSLRYLERVTVRISPDDIEKFKCLVKIIREIVDHRDANGRRIENYRTDLSIINIYANVPDRYLKVKDIDRVLIILQSKWGTLVGSEVCTRLLPHMVKCRNKELTTRLYAAMLSYRWITRAGSEGPAPLIEEFWLSETLKEQLPEILGLIAFEAARSTIKVMQDIIERDRLAFHIVSVPSLESLGQPNFPNKFEGILVATARNSIVANVALSPNKGKTMVKDLLEQSHDIFRRLALYAIAKQWVELKDIFWLFASPNLLTDPFVAPELRMLIRENFASFDDTQKRKWIEWIDSAPYSIPDEYKDDQEQAMRYQARWKLRQLSVIRGKGYRPADKLFERYEKVTGKEIFDQSDVIQSGLMWIPSEAESISRRLLELSIPEVVQFLTTKPSDQSLHNNWETENALQKAVEVSPEKFIGGISAFQTVSANLQDALIRGFIQAWKTGKSFNWTSLLGFCRRLVNANIFWTSLNTRLVGDIAELLQVGTQNEAHSFDPALLPEAEEILLTMLAHTPSTVHDEGDLVIATLNSPKGNVVLAAISYSVRVARLKKNDAGDVKWPTAIKEEFTRRLDRRYDDSLEFSVSLGEYLIYLYSLDKEWLMHNIDLIFQKDNERHWKAAFTGYLSRGTVYNELYDTLRNGNHYLKALKTNFAIYFTRERLIEHICFAYLRGVENLDDSESMICQLMNEWNVETINVIINFFQVQRKESQPQDRTKALGIWKILSEHYENKRQLTAEEKVMLSHLARMSVYLDTIEEESLVWLKLSARYSDRGHDTPVLIENLDRLSDISPKNAADVFIEMLNNDIYPDYDEQHVIAAVEKIYKAGYREHGNTIFNLYLLRGYEFLTDVFKHYNP